MIRPSKQFERRLSVVSAAQSVIASQGLPAATLNRIASEAGMSANALLYYYPGLKELLDDVQSQAVERFYDQRLAALELLNDPRERLQAMLVSGLPTGIDDQLCKLLYELGVYARSDAAYAARHIVLFERQVSIYLGILEAGSAQGLFKLQCDAQTLARSLVSLEDGLGLNLMNVVSAIDRKTALGILVSYAEMATACSLSKPGAAAAPTDRAAAKAAGVKRAVRQ